MYYKTAHKYSTLLNVLSYFPPGPPGCSVIKCELPHIRCLMKIYENMSMLTYKRLANKEQNKYLTSIENGSAVQNGSRLQTERRDKEELMHSRVRRT